jgi:phage N-6-adenine-methyltransferase
VGARARTRRCRRCRAPFAVAATGRPRRYCSDSCRKAAYRRRRRRSVHFSSKSVEWSTPQDLFDEFDAEFGFGLDVCATAENAKCARYFTRADDGLARQWAGSCWMNPPYSTIAAWVRKAWESAQAGATVVCLVPSRTDTAWWHDYCARGEVRFLQGRLRFNGAKTFASAVVVFRGHAEGDETGAPTAREVAA